MAQPWPFLIPPSSRHYKVKFSQHSIRACSSDSSIPQPRGTGMLSQSRVAELCQNILMRNNYPAVIFTIFTEKAIKIIPRVPEAPIFISTKSNNSRSFFLRSRPGWAVWAKLTDYWGERGAGPIIMQHSRFSTNHMSEIAKLLTKLLGKH